MKEGIHPEYHDSQYSCAGCGRSWKIGGTLKEIKVNVCSECHPFYTGKQKFVDSAGRIERFKQKYTKK